MLLVFNAVSTNPSFDDDKATQGTPGDPSWTGWVQATAPISIDIFCPAYGMSDGLFLAVRSGSSWLFFTPELMRAVLVWIKGEYNNPPVYVTENGFSDKTGQLNDDGRINYYNYYINNVLQGWWTEL